MRVLILGIGNTLLGDEGVGVAALAAVRAAWEATPRDASAEWLDGGTLSFTLAAPIAECDALVVIDAAEMGVPPGSVGAWVGEQMDAFIGAHRKRSVHEVGLVDLMAISLLAGHWPRRRALIGIQPGAIGWSEALSPPVEAALDEVVRRVLATIDGWIAAPFDDGQ